jgi:hypothetical protein
MKRWDNKPNDWPTGLNVVKKPRGFLARLFPFLEERGTVGRYVYLSGMTEVPVHWESGDVTYHHISEIPGALE